MQILVNSLVNSDKYMQVTISETFDTVGWKDGEAKAPSDVVEFARKSSEEGFPTAFAKLIDSDTWVVIVCGQSPRVAYRAK